MTLSPSPNPALRRILSVTEEELSRIVLDIHDGPVQYLFAALSVLARMEQQINAEEVDRAELEAALKQVNGMVESSLFEIKNFLGAFRPAEFQRRPLGEIIEGLAIQHEQWTGQRVQLTLEALPDDVSLPSRIAVYRILQEALSNSARHGAVDEVTVRALARAEMIFLSVHDQGQGFEPPPIHGPRATEREEHIGLRGMRDRVALIGGKFHLWSRPGKGTHIIIKVPAHA